MTEAQATPEESPRSPGLFSRLLRRLGRFFRALLRKSVYIPIVAVLLVGADAWMVVAINGWEDDAESLRSKATELGESVGALNASIEEAEAEIAVLQEQQVEAALRADELGDEAAAEQALSDGLRDVALELDRCVTNRFKVVKGIWAGTSVAALDAQTDRECAAAKSTLARLAKEMD